MRAAENTMQSQAIGYGLAVLQAVLFSVLGIFGKMLYATGLDAQQAIVLRFFATTVLLGAFMLIRRQKLVSHQPTVYWQAVFFFTSALFYFLAVERLNAGIATVIIYSYPAVVAVAGVFFFKERLTASTVVALLMALGGLALVSGVSMEGTVLDPLGIAFSIASCLLYAAYTMVIQKVGQSEQPLTVTFTLSLTSLAAACIIFAPSVPAMVPLAPYQLLLGALLAIVSTILPTLAYIGSINRIGATRSSLISISQTPFALLFAFLLLGETLTIQQGIGSALIMASIAIVSVAPILLERAH